MIESLRSNEFDFQSQRLVQQTLQKRSHPISEESFFAMAKDIAEAAGTLITSEVARLGLARVIESKVEKSDGSPVSSIDRLVHDFMEVHLGKIADFRFVSEEDPNGPLAFDSISAGEFFWLADPLDGTRDFLAGEKTFAVALSLMRKARTVEEIEVHGAARGYWGVIVDPSEKRTWTASRFTRLQKWIGGKIVELPAGRANATLRILGSRSIPSHRLQQLYDFWGSSDVTRMGSAIKFALIAEGTFDVYPRFGPTSEWDTAAGQILLESEGGGLYSLKTGRPMTYGKTAWSNGGFLAARTTELLEHWTPRMRLHQI